MCDEVTLIQGNVCFRCGKPIDMQDGHTMGIKGLLFRDGDHYSMDIEKREVYGPPQPPQDYIEKKYEVQGRFDNFLSYIFDDDHIVPTACVVFVVVVAMALHVGWFKCAVSGIILKSTCVLCTKTSNTPHFQLLVDPRKVRFSQDSISPRFRDGSPVTGPPKSRHPLVAAVVLRLRGTDLLFAVNNRTLFNAAYNGVERVRIIIVNKPADWSVRFTCKTPWICLTVRGGSLTEHMQLEVTDRCAVNLRLSSLISDEPREICFVVLEARNLIKPNGRETLFSILQEFSGDLNLCEVEGARAYARVRVDVQDADLIKSIIKSIAEQRGRKKVEVREVHGQRQFESPRD